VKAKEYLSQIEKINMMIKNKDAEIGKWKELADNTSAPVLGDKVKTSGAADTMATAVINYVDIEKELIQQKQDLINKHNEIVRTIEQLPAQEYDVLHMLYVQLMPLDEVAELKHRSYSWVATIHGRALSNVQRLLNNRM
jgi:DNA-directed RNA polymerase specialized sigma subunit